MFLFNDKSENMDIFCHSLLTSVLQFRGTGLKQRDTLTNCKSLALSAEVFWCQIQSHVQHQAHLRWCLRMNPSIIINKPLIFPSVFYAVKEAKEFFDRLHIKLMVELHALWSFTPKRSREDASRAAVQHNTPFHYTYILCIFIYFLKIQVNKSCNLLFSQEPNFYFEWREKRKLTHGER